MNADEPGIVAKTFFVTVGALVALGLASLVGIPLYKTVTADGKVTYCYTNSTTYTNPVSHNVVVYDLWGHREWRSDRVLAQNLGDLESVRAAATAYGCELR